MAKVGGPGLKEDGRADDSRFSTDHFKDSEWPFTFIRINRPIQTPKWTLKWSLSLSNYDSFVPNFNLLPRFVIDKIPDF